MGFLKELVKSAATALVEQVGSEIGTAIGSAVGKHASRKIYKRRPKKDEDTKKTPKVDSSK